MKNEPIELLREIRRHNSSGLTKDMQGRIDAALSQQAEPCEHSDHVRPSDRICIECGERVQQAEPDDEIPDFTPGNGNKALRRMAALSLADENQRVTPVEPLLSLSHPLAEPAPAQDEREAFEAWLPSMGDLSTKRSPSDPDRYWDSDVQVMWRVWQGRATRPAQTEQQPEQSETVLVPVSVIEEAAHMLEAHSPGSGSVESFAAQDLRAALSAQGTKP